MLEFVVDSKTRPPIAIYSSFKEEPTDPLAPPVRHSIWYPIVSYSPEYIAMSLAPNPESTPSSWTSRTTRSGGAR